MTEHKNILLDFLIAISAFDEFLDKIYVKTGSDNRIWVMPYEIKNITKTHLCYLFTIKVLGFKKGNDEAVEKLEGFPCIDRWSEPKVVQSFIQWVEENITFVLEEKLIDEVHLGD